MSAEHFRVTLAGVEYRVEEIADILYADPCTTGRDALTANAPNSRDAVAVERSLLIAAIGMAALRIERGQEADLIATVRRMGALADQLETLPLDPAVQGSEEKV